MSTSRWSNIRITDIRRRSSRRPEQRCHRSNGGATRHWRNCSQARHPTPRQLLDRLAQRFGTATGLPANRFTDHRDDGDDAVDDRPVLADGLPFDHIMRETYRMYLRDALDQHADPPPNPYDEPETFVAWLQESQFPTTPRVSRYLRQVYLSRPDLSRAFPEVPGRDTARFFAWAHDHGSHEIPIPARLLPPKQVESRPPHARAPGNHVGESRRIRRRRARHRRGRSPHRQRARRGRHRVRQGAVRAVHASTATHTSTRAPRPTTSISSASIPTRWLRSRTTPANRSSLIDTPSVCGSGRRPSYRRRWHGRSISSTRSGPRRISSPTPSAPARHRASR